MNVAQPVISEERQMITQMYWSEIWLAHGIRYVIHGKSVTILIIVHGIQINKFYIKIKDKHQNFRTTVLSKMWHLWFSGRLSFCILLMSFDWLVLRNYSLVQKTPKILVTGEWSKFLITSQYLILKIWLCSPGLDILRKVNNPSSY